ncbi:hypothetical protein O9H85_13855 [Paenibacillus filicis]|uniref:Uncharacterized protein n=1 Tax=Paenibacillus gyeongsangnamensis TaxID=3388067 RepID=A0ABT4Q9E5_9BACL|nr:hypothetical protein [Paenibacillus filicis]MCZ8513497.1 hypothetical protein [Paenibacillus filicis]
MGKLANKIVGAVFLLAAGILYTAERMNAQEHAALSALNSSTGSGHPSTAIYHEIVPENNLFVWLFLIIGLVMLVFSFPSERRQPR